MKKLVTITALLALAALPLLAGEWHTGQNNLCTDCHTMHFSQTHNWDGTTPVSTTPAKDGNWLSGTGPNHYLLKAPVNELCLQCHDGQTFAPDVAGSDTNGGTNRSAGALNRASLSDAGYAAHTGHTLDATDVPPGFNPAAVGLSATWYDATKGLECISCHTQHGVAGSYRNLGPRALATSANRTSYVIGTTNDTTKDVWINIPSGYVPNTGVAATFNPFYSSDNVSYNRVDRTISTTKTSNGIDTQCAACHGNFHGGPGDAAIGATGTALHEFLRHPTSQVVIGAAAAQGYGGTSSLSRFVGASTKVKVYASDRTAYADASPGCVSCHKAHGNKNPFGLVFLNRAASSVNEEGGMATGQVEAANGYQVGYRNLCGQCHSQGN